MRHDIDADLKAAVTISKTEANANVKATYFLMMRSPVYNLFGRYNHRCVEEILKNGHTIGLHYDEGFYPSNYSDLQELVEAEAAVVERIFGQKISVVSFHQPGARVLNNEIKLKGFLNTYDKQDMESLYYISDSNMKWKSDTIWDLIEKNERKRIQLLTHPMWWVGDGSQNTFDLWDKALTDNFNRTLDQIVETEGAFGSRREFKLTRR